MHGGIKSQIGLKRLSTHALEARKRLHPGESLLSPSAGRLGPETVLGSLTTLQASLCSHTCSVSAPPLWWSWSLSVASLEAAPSIRFSLFAPKHSASPAEVAVILGVVSVNFWSHGMIPSLLLLCSFFSFSVFLNSLHDVTRG